MSKTILVIEDNNDIRENTAEILELAGFRALTAKNGRKGVDAALKEKPDLIICDIMMPELDGYGVLHLIRKNPDTAAVPFIFLTAKSERSDFRKGMEMGADDYITKPFDDSELLSAVETRLKKAEVLEHKYPSTVTGLAQFIKDVNGLDKVEKLTEEYELNSYEKRTVLFQEGKRPRFLYYLVKGKVKCFKNHEDGKEYITNLYSDGDFIGYTALIEDGNYEERAIIMEHSELVQIPKDDFIKMIHSDIIIAAKFIHIIAKNIKEKEERLLNLAYSSLRKRVAKALVEIVDKFQATDPTKPLEISREEIAQYIGTATESLNRTIGDFKMEGLIDISKGKILPVNMDQMRILPY
ncbi:MAG: response regulator [Ferruginibacter sp.]|nr:response regulator [Ferruginibacter sp.]